VVLLRPAPFGGRAFVFRATDKSQAQLIAGLAASIPISQGSQTMARHSNRTARNGMFDGGGGDRALGKGFVGALKADFARHGASRIRKLRKQQPYDYLKLVASLLPQAFGAATAQPPPVSTEAEFARELEILSAFAAEYDKARSASKD
jgi:hypothetical protein